MSAYGLGDVVPLATALLCLHLQEKTNVMSTAINVLASSSFDRQSNSDNSNTDNDMSAVDGGSGTEKEGTIQKCDYCGRPSPKVGKIINGKECRFCRGVCRAASYRMQQAAASGKQIIARPRSHSPQPVKEWRIVQPSKQNPNPLTLVNVSDPPHHPDKEQSN